MADDSLGEADFYLEGEAEPSLTIPGNVGTVLWESNGWSDLNQRVPAFFDQFEGYLVPLEHLANLAEVCRDLAARYEPERVYLSVSRGVTRRPGGEWNDTEETTTATGGEVRQALLALADVAERALKCGRAVWADLQ
jgi:hypothetical protein